LRRGKTARFETKLRVGKEGSNAGTKTGREMRGKRAGKKLREPKKKRKKGKVRENSGKRGGGTITNNSRNHQGTQNGQNRTHGDRLGGTWGRIKTTKYPGEESENMGKKWHGGTTKTDQARKGVGTAIQFSPAKREKQTTSDEKTSTPN